jgi:hypothetical protein
MECRICKTTYLNLFYVHEFSKESFENLLKMTGSTFVRWETYSFKKIPNFIYNHMHFGTKARAILSKVA